MGAGAGGGNDPGGAVAQQESKAAIYAAIAGNLAIAISKFIAAAITRSSSILAEGIHSLVDTADGGLLLLGMRRSGKRADPLHPFGYGQELYFWTLIVAVMIFAAGGGASIWEGVLHILHPEELSDPKWSYVVLAVAALFEGTTWVFGLRAFLGVKREESMVREVHTSKDPTSFMVLFEDSAALAGIAVAALGVWLSHRLGEPWIDGAASIVIGLILCAVATFLTYESKALLVGERARPEVVENIQRLAVDDRAVEKVGRVLTMHLAPDQVLLNLEVELSPDLSTRGVVESVDRIEAALRDAHPELVHIFVEPKTVEETRVSA